MGIKEIKSGEKKLPLVENLRFSILGNRSRVFGGVGMSADQVWYSTKPNRTELLDSGQKSDNGYRWKGARMRKICESGNRRRFVLWKVQREHSRDLACDLITGFRVIDHFSINIFFVGDATLVMMWNGPSMRGPARTSHEI